LYFSITLITVPSFSLCKILQNSQRNQFYNAFQHTAVQQNKMVMFSDVPVFAETSVTYVQLLVLGQKIKMEGVLHKYKLSEPTGSDSCQNVVMLSHVGQYSIKVQFN
jgi:hypothetical protein